MFVVEDHPFMREMIETLLTLESDIKICGVEANAEDALLAPNLHSADVLLTDVSLPGMSGLDLVEVIARRWPAMRCVMVSGHKEDGYIERARQLGVRGYVLKGHPEELVEAVHAVAADQDYFSPRLREC